MLQKALSYLVGLKENKTYEINGKTYSDNALHLIEDERFYRKTVEFGSLRHRTPGTPFNRLTDDASFNMFQPGSRIIKIHTITNSNRIITMFE